MPDPAEQSTIPSPRPSSNDRLSALALAAESPAASRRSYPDLHRMDPEDLGDLVPVHVGRLGARDHLDACRLAGVVDAPGETGFGLDVSVLDKGGLEAAGDLDRDAERPQDPRA